jgi:hypothetical protein
MIDDMQTAALLSAGMKVLRDKPGTVEAAVFIAALTGNTFDYTTVAQSVPLAEQER